MNKNLKIKVVLRRFLTIIILIIPFFSKLSHAFAEELPKLQVQSRAWNSSDQEWRRLDASEKAGWRAGNKSFSLNDAGWIEKDKTALVLWREQEDAFKKKDEKWRTWDSK